MSTINHNLKHFNVKKKIQQEELIDILLSGENMNFNPMEIAKALNCLRERFGCSQDALASHIGKKRSTVANYLRLLSLPKSIQDKLREGLITMGHAKAILSLKNEDHQNHLCRLVLDESLNVRDTEEAAQRLAQNEKIKAIDYAKSDIYLQEIASKAQQKLGTKVNIQGKGQGGKLTIDYYNLDDLDRLLALLGIEF